MLFGWRHLGGSVGECRGCAAPARRGFGERPRDIDVEKLADLLARVAAEKEAADAEGRDADVGQFREEGEAILNKAGIALPEIATLKDAMRPKTAVYVMPGGDVLTDCGLRG
mgnify:CR=1 FL=1